MGKNSHILELEPKWSYTISLKKHGMKPTGMYTKKMKVVEICNRDKGGGNNFEILLFVNHIKHRQWI